MKSVLIVDDDVNVPLSIGVRLKSMGHTIYTAKDADSAAFLTKPFAATTLVDAIERTLSPADSWQPSLHSA